MPFVALSDSKGSFSTKQLMIICFGNAIAYFDFLIYLFLADIISAAFFPINDDPLISKLQAISVFAAGYLSRPIGGMIIGRYADVYGRKPALLISLLCISITTLIIACLPTYAQVGMLAPILFIGLRLIQGVAFGAHTPLGWVFVAEYVPKKNLATYLSFVTSSFVLGMIGANIIFDLLTTTHTQAELIESGWRIPFIWGAMLSFISLMLWHMLRETPTFLAYKNNCSTVRSMRDVKVSFKRFNAIFLAFLLSFIMSSLTITVSLVLPELILLKFSVDESMLNFSHKLSALFLILGYIFYGLIADKSSVGKALMIGSITLILQALAFYYHLSETGGIFILFMYAILGFCTGIISLGAVVLVQLFPTETRTTAISTIYNLVYAVVGVTLPFGLAYATNLVSFSPALYLTFVGIMSFIIGLYMFRSPKLKAVDASCR